MNSPGNISDFLGLSSIFWLFSGEFVVGITSSEGALIVSLAKYVSENLSIGKIDELGGGEDVLK